MIALVGYTGFVGSNIYMGANGRIDALYNSKNISDAYGTNPDLLIYSGLRAEKYLANNAPKKDLELIYQAQDNIRKINPRKLVLISTIDVFKTPKYVDESTPIDTHNLHAYGYNRYQLELWVRENYPDALIVRLPGLFGKNIKKNFIYDYINIIPFMLNGEKMDEVSLKDNGIKAYYTLQDNGFYKVKDLAEDDRQILKDRFQKVGFTALNFTDSRNKYQFYNLANLWSDINKVLEADIRLWHPATQPVMAGEVYEYLTGEKFINELNGIPVDYDYRTIYGEVFGTENGYICDKECVLKDIKDFVSGEIGKGERD
jgi:hypothetical protein